VVGSAFARALRKASSQVAKRWVGMCLQGCDIGFKSLTEQIDTTTSGGKLIFHIFGALAEFERDIIRNRTNAPAY